MSQTRILTQRFGKVCARAGCPKIFIPPANRPGAKYCSVTCKNAQNSHDRKSKLKYLNELQLNGTLEECYQRDLSAGMNASVTFDVWLGAARTRALYRDGKLSPEEFARITSLPKDDPDSEDGSDGA